MRQYVFKRFGLFIPTVLILTIIVFVLMRIIPGDPALAILNDGEGSYTQQNLDDLRRELGTDQPIVVQYFDWIGGVLQFFDTHDVSTCRKRWIFRIRALSTS